MSESKAVEQWPLLTHQKRDELLTACYQAGVNSAGKWLSECAIEAIEKLEAGMNVFKERINKALEIALRYGGIDGAHHKTWVIDQMARVLTAHKYDEWVNKAKDGPEGPDTYEWDEGIAP